MREPSTPVMFLIALVFVALGAIIIGSIDFQEGIQEEEKPQPAIIRF